MADLIRNSKPLQLCADFFKIEKDIILECFREDPQVISAEYANGMLIIKTKIDASPIIVEINLRD